MMKSSLRSIRMLAADQPSIISSDWLKKTLTTSAISIVGAALLSLSSLATASSLRPVGTKITLGSESLVWLYLGNTWTHSDTNTRPTAKNPLCLTVGSIGGCFVSVYNNSASAPKVTSVFPYVNTGTL